MKDKDLRHELLRGGIIYMDNRRDKPYITFFANRICRLEHEVALLAKTNKLLLKHLELELRQPNTEYELVSTHVQQTPTTATSR